MSTVGRHFLLKDKLLDVGDRTLRLQVAMDITKKEYVRPAHPGAAGICRSHCGHVDLLSRQKHWYQAVEAVLAAMGEIL